MEIGNLFLRLVGISRRSIVINDGDVDKQVLTGLKKLLRKAEKSVKIVSGELPYRVYSQPRLIEVIKDALENKKIGVEVVAGPAADERSVEILSSNGASVYQLDQRPTLHYFVIDGKHVRIEEPHDEHQKYRTFYTVYNFKYARLLEKKFREMKKQAEKVEVK